MTNPLTELADRCERAQRSDNALDVLVEVALFKPDRVFASVRANSAGTKVIFTGHDGSEMTRWAADWTLTEDRRHRTAAALRAISKGEG